MDNLLVQCVGCDSTFELTPEVIGEARVEINGTKITATTILCNSCKRVTLVQLDNEETLELLRQYKQLAVLRTMRRRKGQDIKDKQIKRMNELQKELDHKRQDLKTQNWESVTCLLAEKSTGQPN